MNSWIRILTLGMLGLWAASTAQAEDVVYLKDGTVVRGLILEQIPEQTLQLKTSDGNVSIFSMDKIKKIEHVPDQSAEITPSPSPAVEKRGLTLGIAPALSIPISSEAENEYAMGAGIQLSVQIPFKDPLGGTTNTLGLLIGYQNCSLNINPLYNELGLDISGGFQTLSLMVAETHYFGDSQVRPYGIVGIGIAFNGSSTSYG